MNFFNNESKKNTKKLIEKREINFISLSYDEVIKYQKNFIVELENTNIEKLKKRKKIIIDLSLDDEEFKYNKKMEKRILRDDRIIKNLSPFNALEINFVKEKEKDIKININK